MSEELMKCTKEDLYCLLNEVTEVKEVLRDLSQQVRRIERRISAALPKSSEAHSRQSPRVRSKDRSTMDDDAASQGIDQLKLRATKGEQIENHLRKFTVKPELQSIARILGMTNTKLPPKDELVLRISTRLRQSVSVSTGIQDDVRS